MSGSRLSFALAALAVAGALAFAAACKSSTGTNSCGSGTPPALVGTYSLDSYVVSGGAQAGATGELRLNADSTYGADINVPGAGTIPDSGTYRIQGSACISQNSVLGQPQFVGTFILRNGVLTVSGTAGGLAVTSAWTKTS